MHGTSRASEGMTESFAELFEQSLANQRIRPGMILTGLVVDVTPDVVIVNVGLKSEIVTGIITGRVKGGFTVEIDNVRAFLPGPLVDVRPVRDTSYLKNKPLEFKVIK